MLRWHRIKNTRPSNAPVPFDVPSPGVPKSEQGGVLFSRISGERPSFIGTNNCNTVVCGVVVAKLGSAYCTPPNRTGVQRLP